MQVKKYSKKAPNTQHLTRSSMQHTDKNMSYEHSATMSKGTTTASISNVQKLKTACFMFLKAIFTDNFIYS